MVRLSCVFVNYGTEIVTENKFQCLCEGALILMNDVISSAFDLLQETREIIASCVLIQWTLKRGLSSEI